MSLSGTLREKRSSNIARAQEIAQLAVNENRDLTVDEKSTFDYLISEANEAGRRADDLDEGERRAGELEASYNSSNALFTTNPLAVRADVLDAVQNALSGRTAGSWEARAALTSSNVLGQESWTGVTLAGPRMLHVAAGIQQETSLGAIHANYLRVGSLSAATGIAEGSSAGELTAVTGASSSLMRYGRWTDLTEEAQIASDAAGSITLVQRRAIAKDLDNLLIGLVAADSPTGSSVTASSADKALRRSLAIVSDNVGQDASELTIVANPSAADSIEDISAVGGGTLGEPVVRFAGSRLYYSSACPSGYAFVLAPTAFVYLESQPVTFRTDLDLKTSVLTLATSVIAGYGNQRIAGGVQRATF